MKKILLSIITVIVCAVSYGQNDNKKLPSLGVNLFFNDFQTAADVRANGLANVVRDKQWSKSRRMTAGLAISYLQGLSNKLDFAASLSGSIGEYPVPNKLSTNQQKFILEGAAMVNLKLLSDKYYINPYITAGVGASKFKGYYGAFIPVGAGMQIKIVDNIFLVANSQYRVAITENAAYHFYHSFGVIAPIKKK
jgi:OmpA-OmpF porin, OOP family